MTNTLTNSKKRRFFIAVLCAGMLAGGVLRFAGLGNRDFWFDESCTFIYVHDLFDWPEDSSLLAESTNLPYYFVLRGWTSLFGDSESAYRAMSALVATLVVPLLGFLAWRMAGALAGAICIGLVALNPLHIHYAHEARAYALWTLVLSLALFLLYEAAKNGRWRWWTLYGVVLLFALHLHYFTAYWVPATVAVALVADQCARCLRRWLITTVAVGAGFVPYFLFAVWRAARAGGSAWVAEHWEPLTAIPQTLWTFLPAGGYPAHLRGLSLASVDTVRFSQSWLIAATAAVRVVPAIIVVVVSVLLVRRRWLNQRGADSPRYESSPHLFLAMMTLLPLVLAWAYSMLIRPNYLVGRYDLVAWPAGMVWLAVIIAEVVRTIGLKKRALAAALICVPLLACSVVPIARMAALKPGPTFHNVRAQLVADLTDPNDLVIALSYDRDYLQYYLHRAGFAARIISFPSWLDRQIGWVDTDADAASDKATLLKKDAAARVTLVGQVIEQGSRVFLLLDSLDPGGSGPRAAINRCLLDELISRGYERRVVDEPLLVVELLKPRHSD